MKTLRVLLLSTAIASVGSFSLMAEEAAQASAEAKTLAKTVSGIDLTALDRSVKPQDDFYAFANGGWIKNTDIPSIYSGYTIYHEVYEDAEKSLRAIIQEASAGPNKSGSEAQKVGDLFASWMDQATIEARGLSPIKADLKMIQRATDKQAIGALFAHFIRNSLEVPFSFSIYPDLANSSEYMVYFNQNGLTLPNRDYYLETDNENFTKAREALPGFIKTMMSFVVPDMTKERAQAVYNLEAQIAKHHWTAVENRNDDKTYNPYTQADLASLGSNIDWISLLNAMGMARMESVIISQPSYFEAMDKLVGDTDLQVWKDYLTYNLIRNNSAHLTYQVDNAAFEFFGKTLSGQTEQRPRWKRGVSVVNGSLGEAVGKLYVERHFPAAAKEKMNELVNNVLAVFDESIDNLDWMSADTKKEAKEKRSKFTAKIGYPDKWRDYSSMEIKRGDHFGNWRRVQAHEYSREIGKLSQPIDRDEWFMTPQTVNAYYDPTQNEIVFPAARLQPPFFQLNADDAINYGAIGGVIGHEISHGFDDSGSKFDGDGNLRNWWTAADRAAFNKKTKILIKQYSAYEPIEGMKVNGELTLGENIGDLSGVTVAYKAYIRSLNGKEPAVIDGFTGPQRFFIGYAMSRKGKYKEQTIVRRLASDTHSPLKFRVNGVYRNMPEFYEAFGVKEGDGMWLAPEDRVSIW